MATNVYHKRDIFKTSVEILVTRYDVVHQKLSSPVKVIILFDYQIRHFVAQESNSDETSGEIISILERSDFEKRGTTFHLDLSELEVYKVSYELLSPEHLKLGVKPSRHKGIVKKIINLISVVGSTPPDKVVVIPMSKVELIRFRSKWLCGVCSKVKARSLLIKEVVKSF